jgi:DNA-binding Lrp family transcriptional regulator
MPESEQPRPIEIDETDRKIIEILLDKANLSYRKIAKKLMISPVTVMNRVQKLERGIIRKYTVQLDYDRLGFDLSACINVRVEKGKLFEVERQIAKHPRVQSVYDITGDFDVLVLAKFKSRRELDSFVKRLQAMEHVDRTETNIVLNTIKEENLRP